MTSFLDSKNSITNSLLSKLAGTTSPIFTSPQRAKVLTRREQERQEEEQIIQSLPKGDSIPADPDAFYRDFGLLLHPLTGEPVTRLTAYQRRVWIEGQRHRYLLVVKSHRIGLSTSELLHDFWHSITDCKGQEILVIAQDLEHAKDHLYTLRKLILASHKYRGYLINKASDLLSRDEITKVMTIYIRNVDNPDHPTRIIGLGASPGATWSWKNVKHVHMSDIASTKVDYTETVNGALTRLALSGGHMLIESPPVGPWGMTYELYKKALDAERDPRIAESAAGQAFRLIQIDYTAAVDAGVMSQDYADQMKVVMGNEFDSYFGAKFSAIGGNVFNLDALERSQVLGRNYSPDQQAVDVYSQKSLGVDVGWGSSDTAFVILERTNGLIRVLLAESFVRPRFEDMIDQAFYYLKRYGINKTYVDGSAHDFIKSLKIKVGEELPGEQDYMDKIKDYQKDGVNYELLMDIVPVNFSNQGRQMLLHTKQIVEMHDLFAIDPDKFQLLSNEMQTATETNGKLDKDRLNYDLLDSLQLACQYYRVEALAKRP